MYAVQIYQSSSTVFTINELALLFGEANGDRLKSRINYYVKKNILLNLRRGIYAKPNFSFEELATKIYTPSYISFETVLLKEGVIFQYYETIFTASYLSRSIKVSDKNIQYRRLPAQILNNSCGIVNKGNYMIATKERAFMDMVYLYKSLYFDNLTKLDKNILKEVFTVYPENTVKNAKKILNA